MFHIGEFYEGFLGSTNSPKEWKEHNFIFTWQDASAVAKGASIDAEKADSRRTQDSRGRVTKGVRYHPERYWNLSDGPWGSMLDGGSEREEANRLSEENSGNKRQAVSVGLKRNEDYSRGRLYLGRGVTFPQVRRRQSCSR